MNLRPVAVAGVVAVGAMLGLAAWAWTQIPPGAQVPIHWGIDGQPDGFASKELALLLTPVLTVFLGALLYYLPRFEPRAQNLAQSGPALRPGLRRAARPDGRAPADGESWPRSARRSTSTSS